MTALPLPTYPLPASGSFQADPTERFLTLMDQHFDLTDPEALTMLARECPRPLRLQLHALINNYASPEARCDLGPS